MRGRSPLPFFKNRKKVPWFCKKVPWFWKNVPCLCASVGWNYNLKRTFKSILEKKDQNFSLRGFFFVYHTWNVYRSAPIPGKLFCPEKLLVACLHLNDLCNHNSSIQFGGIEAFCPLRHILIWGYWNILSLWTYFDLDYWNILSSKIK